MAPRSGLSAYIGYGIEDEPGVAVEPTVFVPLVSESLSQERERLESEGIIAGRRTLDSEQWNGGPITVGGDIQHELYASGLRSLFVAMLGAVSTTGEGPYTHTITPGDLDDHALTIEVGRPGVAGAIHRFRYAGCKVTSWEIACQQSQIATLGLTVVGQTEGIVTSGSTAPVFTSVRPFKFNHGALSIAGSPVKVRAATLSGDNGLAVGRRSLGQEHVDEPLEEELRTYDGSTEAEFVDLALYRRFIDGDEGPLVLSFTAGDRSVTITENVRFDGETPNVGGRQILTQNLPFKAIGDGADEAAITVVLVDDEDPS